MAPSFTWSPMLCRRCKIKLNLWSIKLYRVGKMLLW